MTTTEIPSLDKAAIVLCCLVPDQAERALEMLGSESADPLRERMKYYASLPDLGGLRDQVLQEFAELQRRLEAELWAASRLPSGEPPPAPVAETAPPPAAPAGPDEVKESDDPLKDIGELTAEQLFVALRAENPRTIGIVLHQVPPEKAAEVLTKLSPNLRRATFVEMAKGVPNNPELVARLIRAVVQSCDEMEHSTTGTRVFRTLAEMLHSVQREDRGAMMEALQESDSHAAERVDDLLFNFEDLIQIEDRTLQRILGEIDTRVLAEALYGASDALSKKVMMNRSARVQKMITEEMEVMGAVSPEANYQARRKVVEVIRKFDREGHLHWVE